TLTVEAFRPDDAQAMAETLLAGGEQLINELNERSSANAIAEANAAREVARQRLAEAEAQLTAFRNSEAFVDPEATARIRSQLIGGLLGAAAELRAERAQLQASAPQSPMLAGLDGRIAALEGQIAVEQAKLSGGPGALAPRLGMFETLRLNRELADRELAQATAAVVTAEQEARRQRLYLDRIVSPHRPDEAIEPRRWLSILTVLATCVLIYGVGWLIWAGVREHRQD
ncbi:MAG: chain-length determining protein, partial [Brevundimonas sp.]